MKRNCIVLLVLIMAVCVLLPGCGQSAKGLYEKAQSASKSFEFTKARDLYREAQKKATSESDAVTARKCREGLRSIDCYYVDYPYDIYQIKSELKKTYPDIPESKRNSWIANGKLEEIQVDGETRFLATAPYNVAYRDMKLFHADEKMTNGYNKFVSETYTTLVQKPRPPVSQYYMNPASWKGTQTIEVPRKKLPEKGKLQVWVPAPVKTDSQPAAAVTVMEPAEYVKYHQTEGDIGDVYYEIELDKLKEDLNIRVEFQFTHMEQNFQVDPAGVGKYDKNDEEYKKYTRSYGNTTITPEIETKAREIVGKETNPYRKAKKIYDYVVNNVTYSLIPECTCWPRGKPISVYVHENQYGDCGGQSMYFSALCRSQGIPSRSTGGWQLFSGQFQGHFWAEFYLPNYGWVPVDTSVAQMADYTTNMTSQQKKEFKDYYFGNMDNMRCVIQTDVDTPVVPTPDELVFSPGALQAPDALCETMDDIPAVVIDKYWTNQAERTQ